MVTGQLLFILSVSLLTYKTDQEMAPRSASKKSVSEKELLFVRFCEYVKLPFLLRVPKKYVSILERDKLLSLIDNSDNK
jgi:hypothetical protein